MSVNKVQLLGNVGDDPKITTFQDGGMTAQLSLATTKRGFKTKDGKEVPERTEWHNVVLSNGLAKVAKEYVKKGDKLFIEGELRTRSYDDKNTGIKRYITEVYAYDMEMLTPKKSGAPAPAPANDYGQPYYGQSDRPAFMDDDPLL